MRLSTVFAPHSATPRTPAEAANGRPSGVAIVAPNAAPYFAYSFVCSRMAGNHALFLSIQESNFPFPGSGFLTASRVISTSLRPAPYAAHMAPPVAVVATPVASILPAHPATTAPGPAARATGAVIPTFAN